MIAQQIIKNVKQKLSPKKEPKLKILDGETKVATEAVIRIFEFLRFAIPITQSLQQKHPSGSYHAAFLLQRCMFAITMSIVFVLCGEKW